MSERSRRDERYAVWWLPLFYFVLALIGLTVVALSVSGEIRDLKHRVDWLESVAK